MNAAHPPPELHLPDLPEVPVTLGPAVPRQDGRLRQPLGVRLHDAMSTYLPLLLMVLLALGTWWLVRNTPAGQEAPVARPVRTDPDYTMRGFSLSRFGADGRFAVRIEGDVMRHFPDTDRFEVEGVRIDAVAPDGRTTRASARRALANGDASEVQLLGAARVVAELGPGDRVEIEGEFLHAFVRFERLRSHLPVKVRRGEATTDAGGFDYDHLERRLKLDGPVRSSLLPSSTSGAAARNTRP